MSGKHIVDIAYSAAKDKYEDKSFTFNELFSLIKQNEKSDSRKLTLGEIYTELLLDPRFAYVSNGN
jgi:DNA-directed RNA polymerase delta subunit